MSVPVSTELWVFLWSICAGILMGFVFDIFRIKRKIIKTGIVLITFEDLLYWVIAAFIFFFTVYLFNDGQIRGYSLMGCLLGAVFYFSAISPIILKVSVTVINTIIRAVRFLIKIIAFPVKFMIKIIKPPVKWIGKEIGTCSGKCKTLYKKETKSMYSKGIAIFKKRKRIKNNNKNN